jgi:hypothetical protein
MIVLVSGATTTMAQLADPRFGVLVVPEARNRPTSLRLTPGTWAMDNGAYHGFKPAPFVRMLEVFYPWRAGCRFVAAPDVVGDAATTLQQWPFWSGLIRGCGYPPALVAQDGLTVQQVLWDEMTTLFIGGTTTWKESADAATLAAYAHARGIQVHWGRVSTLRRLKHVRRVGADSLDTSGLSRWPDEMVRRFSGWLTRLEQQPELAL